MKLVSSLFVTLVLTIAMSGVALAEPKGPEGSHVDLSIAAVPESMNIHVDSNSSSEIFVKSQERAVIDASLGSSFQIIDSNAVDGSAMLKLPDASSSSEAAYTVWVRALSEPTGSDAAALCATSAEGSTFCRLDTFVVRGSASEGQAINIAPELLTVDGNLVANADAGTISLFSDSLQGIFWTRAENGMKVADFSLFQSR